MEDVDRCPGPDQLPHRRKRLKSKREEFHSAWNTNLLDPARVQGSTKATHRVKNQSTTLLSLQRSGVHILTTLRLLSDFSCSVRTIRGYHRLWCKEPHKSKFHALKRNSFSAFLMKCLYHQTIHICTTLLVTKMPKLPCAKWSCYQQCDQICLLVSEHHPKVFSCTGHQEMEKHF